MTSSSSGHLHDIFRKKPKAWWVFPLPESETSLAMTSLPSQPKSLTLSPSSAPFTTRPHAASAPFPFQVVLVGITTYLQLLFSPPAILLPISVPPSGQPNLAQHHWGNVPTLPREPEHRTLPFLTWLSIQGPPHSGSSPACQHRPALSAQIYRPHAPVL